MIIGGLIKHSLIDYPGRSATVLFTQGCGWRCPYCHNGRLIPARAPDPISQETVFTLLAKHPQAARNLVISGGEPTLQNDLIDFLQEAHIRGIHCKLDTNGSRPSTLRRILEKVLVDYVAMDVKGPLERYREFCGRDLDAANIAESISLLKHSSIDYEFRTTAVPALHSPDDFSQIGQYLEGGKRLILQAFQAPHARGAALRDSEEPDAAFMQACADRAKVWLPTEIRDAELRVN